MDRYVYQPCFWPKSVKFKCLELAWNDSENKLHPAGRYLFSIHLLCPGASTFFDPCSVFVESSPPHSGSS